MGRILVLLVGIAIVALVVLMMFRGPGAGPGLGEGSGALATDSPSAENAAPAAPLELLVEGSGILVDDVPTATVEAALAAAQAANTAGRAITLVIPGSAAAATVTVLRDALDAAQLTYSVSINH
jgi:hypothetical protein